MLHRLRSKGEEKQKEKLLGNLLPPFVRIQRTLVFGTKWEVRSTAIKVTKGEGAAVLKIPLLPGEAVTTPGIRIKDGRIVITLGQQNSSLSWHSTLERADQLVLQASKTSDWAETWSVHSGYIWHVSFEGHPPISRKSLSNKLLPTWRPWPGEKVTLKIQRPTAVPGEVVTIDKVELRNMPGKRSSKSKLSLTIRSSKAGQHRITLPAGASLQTAHINGRLKRIRPEGGIVTIPTTPGKQKLELLWRNKISLSPFYKTPTVEIGAKGVNFDLNIHLPKRWILLFGGPGIGPALLFWGKLFLIALFSFVLGKFTFTPLKTIHWFLLGLGLAQTTLIPSFIVIGFILTLGWKGKALAVKNRHLFNLVQVFLGLWSVATLWALLDAISNGLVSSPQMQITGNGSSNSFLRWYIDHFSAELPKAWVISLPPAVFKVMMLIWSLWLAIVLLKWFRWGWKSYSCHGLWSPKNT